MTARGDSTERSKVSVLVVEDDPFFREIVAQALESTGYLTLTAFSGSEALSLAESGVPIDLLLADVVMHDMSGVELAGRMHDQRPDLPVVFMSGYAQSDLREQGLIPPEAPALHKPFELGELRSRVFDSVHPGKNGERGRA